MDDQAARYDATVSAIYDAALMPELLPNAMEAVRGLLDCDIYHLFAWDVNRQLPARAWASLPATDSIHHGYNAYYGRIDPRRELTELTRVGEVFACSRHFGTRYVAVSEFYQDFLLPNGLRYMLGTALSRGGGQEYKLGMLRALGRPDYTDSDVALATRLAAHLSRALALMSSLQSCSTVAVAHDHSLDLLDAALALLDESGQLIHISASGVAMLRRHAIRIGAYGLILRGADKFSFEATWERVRATGRPASLSLRGGGTSTLFATLLRVPERDFHAHATNARFSLLLTESVHRVATAAILCATFRLTRAEAELARDLAVGLSLADSARRRGVRDSTARSQLLSLFAKTDTNRQADLVRLLGRLPAVGSS